METRQGVETIPLCMLFPAPGSFLLAILAAGLAVVAHGAASMVETAHSAVTRGGG